MTFFDRRALGDPDCLRCMRMKLRATSVVVFFRDPDLGWRVGSFQGDRPSDVAEVEFYQMLQAGMPEKIAQYPGGLVMNEQDEIEKVVGELAPIFLESSVIAAPVSVNGHEGIRIAWREKSDPFSLKELDIMQCSGMCPAGCGIESAEAHLQ